MDFVNGKHLANYLLKIFKNNGVDVPKENIDNIKDLENIFTFISNLPLQIRNDIDFSNEYYNWITLAQSNKYQKLSEISNAGNENIIRFTNNPSIISFDTVFKSFELDIEYKLSYLHTKPEDNDIYYPHFLKISKYALAISHETGLIAMTSGHLNWLRSSTWILAICLLFFWKYVIVNT